VAGIGLFLAGVLHFGGFVDFWALLPQSHKYAFSEFNQPDKFSFMGIWCQDGLANTGAFMLMNQGIIMRFLSLKSVKDARKMAVCWILVLAPLACIAVSGGGWIAKALVANGEIELTDPNDAFVGAALFLCAPGIFGFVLAALTAALMSTADTLVTAVSAIFINDVYRPYLKRGASDRHYLRIARVTSMTTVIIGVLLVLVFMQEKSIYQAHAKFTAAVTPPIVVAILLGILWKRSTPAASFLTMVGGGILVGLSFIWPETLIKPFAFGMGEGSYKYMRALYGLVVCGALGITMTTLGIIVAWLTKLHLASEIKKLVRNTRLEALGVIVEWFKPRPLSAIRGLVTGTQLDAMRLFKGGEINRREGKKARVRITSDPSLSGTDVVIAPQSALDRMAAEEGDLLYVCEPRWWFGGLRSVHVKAGQPGADDTLRLSPEGVANAHFTDGQDVLVEKIF
jgi:solute:Na+ symporter, SSS family